MAGDASEGGDDEPTEEEGILGMHEHRRSRGSLTRMLGIGGDAVEQRVNDDLSSRRRWRQRLSNNRGNIKLTWGIEIRDGDDA